MGVTVLGIQHHFYPRSPCGERLTPARMSSRLSVISIHALLAESDSSVSTHCKTVQDFYPRSPCGERLGAGRLILTVQYFYPRSPCGERLLRCLISLLSLPFLSTLSLRRATDVKSPIFAVTSISIHALLAESDRCKKPNFCGYIHFYPRSPCGERLMD